jgi:transcriptional regulator with XRE-family HTH domain
MLSGEELRELREAAELGLREMGRRTFISPSLLSMVETGRRDVTSEVLSAYERVLGLELRGDETVQRRDFLWLLGVAGANARVATELAASVAGNDPGPLATVQTSHGVDHALAALADQGAIRSLQRWAADEADPVLRVNATGILAKLPSQDKAHEVAGLLGRDPEVRLRYTTAVVRRVCGTDWAAASAIATDPASCRRPDEAARYLLREVVNPRDAGARWCSATMLRDLAPLLGGRSL